MSTGEGVCGTESKRNKNGEVNYHIVFCFVFSPPAGGGADSEMILYRKRFSVTACICMCFDSIIKSKSSARHSTHSYHRLGGKGVGGLGPRWGGTKKPVLVSNCRKYKDVGLMLTKSNIAYKTQAEALALCRLLNFFVV